MVDKAMDLFRTITPVINMITSALVVVAIAVMSYIMSQITGLREEISMVNSEMMVNSKALAALEASRFTNVEAVRFMSDVSQRITSTDKEVSAKLSALQTAIARLPTEVPPKWFIDKVEKNSEAIEKLKEHKD